MPAAPRGGGRVALGDPGGRRHLPGRRRAGRREDRPGRPDRCVRLAAGRPRRAGPRRRHADADAGGVRRSRDRAVPGRRRPRLAGERRTRDLPAAAPARSVAASADRPLAGTTVTMWGVEPAADGRRRRAVRVPGADRHPRAVPHHRRSSTPRSSTARTLGRAARSSLAVRPGRRSATSPRAARSSTSARSSTRRSARRAHGDYLIDLVQRADPASTPSRPTLDLKGLVWYPVPEFEAAGYTVPRDVGRAPRPVEADGRRRPPPLVPRPRIRRGQRLAGHGLDRGARAAARRRRAVRPVGGPRDPVRPPCRSPGDRRCSVRSPSVPAS